MSYVTNNDCRAIQRGARRMGGRGYTTTEEAQTSTICFDSKSSCYAKLFEKMGGYITTSDKEFNSYSNYASDFNSWLMATGYLFTQTTTKHYAPGDGRDVYYEVLRTLRWGTDEGPIEVQGGGVGGSVKEANNRSCYRVFQKIRSQIPRVQSDDTTETNQDYQIELMDRLCWRMWINGQVLPKGYYIPRVQIETPEKTTEQGDVTQESNKEINTIITRDQQQSEAEPTNALDVTTAEASSEPSHDFGTVTQRWMPLESIPITTAHKYNDVISTFYLPEAFYKTNCSPSLIPFETFIYGRMEIEIKAVVNANKFSCGKVVMSSKYDTYQADEISSLTQSALARNHIILDLSANNEGVLNIPFRFHRPAMRLLKSESASSGVRSGKYASLYLHMLSPLKTGPGGPSDINVTLFYRLKEAKFTGMTYRATVQMFGLENAITPKTSRALKEVLGGAERAFDQLGKSNNQDKPGVIGATPVTPRPRVNFATGKGVVDVAPLRINPHTLTNYEKIVVPTDEPKSFYDLARIWGIYKSFQWNKTLDAGKELGSFIVDPSARSYDTVYKGELTPLEYAMDNFTFWTGPIELRFDFVSNAYHTGTVQISAEFGRNTASTNPCESQSTYTKTFHLGDQKTVSFTIPYIYDTVYRRTTSLMCNPYQNVASTDVLSKSSTTVAPLSKTYVKVRVVNALRPIASAPQEIEVLVFMRAGRHFSMQGLKGFSLLQTNPPEVIDEFPFDYAVPTSSGRKKREGEAPTQEQQRSRFTGQPHPNRMLPKDKANEWNEYKPGMIPTVQMDTGAKEEQDRTDNFSQGQQGRATVNTLDLQMNFKDLLRKPVLLHWNVTVKAQDKVGAFMIPLMPPCRAMVADPLSGVTTGYFSKTLASTSTVAIMDMFRVWRGSMRYTFVVHKATAKPIYVSLIPHSGTRMMGDHQIADNAGPYPIAGMNFVTELIVPGVNPTMTIEAPYETENTWTWTWDANPTRNYSWRDKGDTNAGHLAITAHEDVKMDIWWSAGDDFEIANFYGIPSTTYNGFNYRLTDAAKVQMDFRPTETLTKVGGLVKTVCSVGTLGRAAMASIPVVGTPLLMADTVNRVMDQGAELRERADRTLDKVDTLADKLTTSSDQIVELLKAAVEQVTETLGGVIETSTLLFDFMLDIVMAWMERSWKIVGIGIVRFITKIYGVGTRIFDSVLVYGEQLARFLTTYFAENVPRVQSDTDEETLWGILCGIIGTITGVVIDAHEQRRQVRGMDFLHRMTKSSGVSYLLAMLRFVQGIFQTVKTLVMTALGYVSPEAQALKRLSESSEEIKRFVLEAQMMTSEANMVMVNTPRYRRRFWFTVMQAHKIQRLLIQVPNSAVSNQLALLCNKVINFGNERFMDISACPVRFEPFVLCIEGPAGIGKSFITEELVSRLLAAVDVTAYATESIFYRTSGERFWSGYRNQPVVVYDEWLNTTDPTRCVDQIAEMMKLKSTALFIPEMAHLEEKKIRGNPLIVIVLCNNAFPNNLGDYATCPSATLRRRDVVLRMELQEEFEGIDYQNMNPAIKERVDRFEHLKFYKYSDVKDVRSRGGIYKDFDTTAHWLTGRWVRYHTIETGKVRQRMERLPQYIAQAEGGGRISDPFTIFYQMNQHLMEDVEVNQNAWLPSEQLEAAVELVAHAMNQPEPEPRPLEPVVPWELAQAPGVQSDWANTLAQITAGVLWVGTIPALIARATKDQLLHWEMELIGAHAEISICPVCREELACPYVCSQTQHRDGEARHAICVNCYTGIVRFGDGRCPMCRDQHLVLQVNARDLAHVSVWARLAIWACRGTQWLCDKLLAYYSVRREHPLTTALVDMFMQVASNTYRNWHIDDPNDHTAAPFSVVLGMDHLAHYTLTMWQQWGHLSFEQFPVGVSFLQADDWDEGEEVVPQAVPEIDIFQPQINREAFNEWVTLTTNGRCMHHLLRRSITVAQLNGEFWEVPDRETRTTKIRIPVHKCEQCVLDDNEYRQLIERWSVMKRLYLRNQYIALYNIPTLETYNQIDPIFRPEWFEEPELVVTDSWWEWLSEKWENYKQLIKYMVLATAVTAVAYKLYTSAKSLLGSECETQGATTGSPDPSPRHAPRHVQRRGATRSYFQAEEQNTPDIIEVAVQRVARNTFKLYLHYNNKSHEMYGTGLFNHYLLIPRHYAREIKTKIMEGAVLYGHPLSSPQLKAEITVTRDTFVESEETDLAYMHIPPKYPLFKDIRNFLATDTDLDQPLPSSGFLLGNPKCGTEFMREISVDIAGLKDRQVVIDQNDRSFEVRDVVVYNYSRAGACGSILFREHHQRPILSMHFAGFGKDNSGEGYGIPITRESLGNLAKNNAVVVQFEDVMYGSVTEMKFDFGENCFVNYLGSVTKEDTPYIPSKSKLVKSAIFGAPDLETDMEPAILDAKDSRYMHDTTPLFEGCKKHGLPTLDFPEELVEEAGEAYWDLWISRMKPTVADPKLLTEEQAILGLDHAYYTPIDLKTSAGYPYSLDKQRTTKEHWLEVERDDQGKIVRVVSLSDRLKCILDHKREVRKRGHVPHTIFIDTLKDEKRDQRKARSLGGTRVFCSSPMDYVIECRQWFLHFVSAFMRQRFELMHAVGIDPTSEEWTRLTNELLTKNSKFGTIDYTNFGAGYNASVARKAYELIIRWTQEHVRGTRGREQEMWCIVYECLQSIHICNNTVYQQGTGSPSGAFFTTIINTMVNHLYLLIAWSVLTKAQLQNTSKLIYPTFKKNVTLFCFGDDGIFSVTPEYEDLYNMNTITDLFADYGITATGADKTGEVQKFEEVSRATFLKRGFLKHPRRRDQWLSPLRFESIVSTTQWVWKSANLKQATFVNAEAAVMQAHGHGPKVFQEFKNVVNRALIRNKCQPVSMGWDEIDHKFYTQGLEFNVEEFLYQNLY